MKKAKSFLINLNKYLIISMIIIGMVFVSGTMPGDSDFNYPSLGNGFSGIANTNTPYAFIDNPALAATAYDNDLTFFLAGFTGFYDLGIAYTTETLYGNLSFYLNYMYNEALNGRYAYFKTNFSKLINENYWAGISLNIFTDSFSNWGFNFDIGVASVSTEEDFSGLGFKNFNWAFVLSNLGTPLSIGNDQILQSIGLNFGVKFDFLQWDNKLLISSYADADLYLYKFGFVFSNGLEFEILEYVNLFGGYRLGTTSILGSDYNMLFFGINFYIPIKTSNLNISYSISPKSDNYIHSVTFNYSFAKKDDEPPVISLKTDMMKFSPDFDGTKDEVNIYPDFKDNSILYGWKVIVKDSEGNVVKEFIGEDVRKVKYVTIGKIIQRLFAKKEEIKIPEFIAWDGTNNEGEVVEDGQYFIHAEVWDEKDNKAKTEDLSVWVDTFVTDIAIEKKEQESNIFSPNNDGNKDIYSIPVNVNDFNEDDKLIVKVKDKDGNVVQTYEFNLEDVKDGKITVDWNGKDINENTVSEGTYSIDITVQDVAGNSKSKQINDVKVITTYENIIASSDIKYFSPNNDGVKDEVKFINEINSVEETISWNAKVIDSNGKIVKVYRGKGLIPNKLNWNGRDDNGSIVSDGVYTYQVEANYVSGNNPKSNKIEIELDNTKPEAEIEESYTSFSPNNDGNKDDVEITVNVDDDLTVKEVKIVDADNNKVSDVELSDDKKVVWNGTDENENPLKEGEYSIQIIVEDKAGNVSTINSNKISLVRGKKEVFASSDINYFSPNNDGRKDKITFSFDTKDRNSVDNSKLVVLDSDNNAIYEKNFNGLPKTHEFSEAIPDGIYSYYVEVKFNFGDTIKSQENKFIVDTVKPKATVETESDYFSPNNDGIKDKVNYQFKIDEDLDNIAFIVKANKEYDRVVLKGNKKSLSYDGGDIDGGAFDAEFVFEDLAGNQTIVTRDLFINRETPKFSAGIDKKLFSPNNDKKEDKVNINYTLNDKSILSKDKFNNMLLEVYDNTGNKVYENTYESKDGLLMYNGLTDAKKYLNDGNYSFIIKAQYESGIEASYKLDDIRVDVTAPSGSTVIRPFNFSPDGDGLNDELYISLDYSDRSQITDYKVEIYRLYPDGKLSTKPFKSFSGDVKGNKNKLDVKLPWNGIGNDGKTLIDSAADYRTIITLNDEVGNKLHISEDFVTDILVMKTDRGYKIIVNSIEFAINSARLKSSAHKILDRLIQILHKERFRDYKVEIVGFTDSTGDAEYNLKLSEKRAKSVYNYFVKHDISSKRLIYVGEGEKTPLDDNSTDEGRRRNRRVEFYLVRDND